MSIQLELECSDAFHIGLLGSLGFLGWVLSLLVIPRAVDRSGRKWIIIISSIAAVVAYIGIMFSTSIYLTYFFILFNGLTLAGRVSVGYVYMMELLPAESRTAVGTTLLALESLIGLFGALVYKNFHTASFRNFAYPGPLLTIIGIIMMSFLPESPIYLLRSD